MDSTIHTDYKDTKHQQKRPRINNKIKEMYDWFREKIILLT